MTNQPLKYGEKVLFSVFGAFLVIALLSFITLEVIREHSHQPMFQILTHYNLTPLGDQGSVYYRKSGCTDCHRAMNSGTNMGLDLDGIGSRHSQQWIESFLHNPEKTYNAVTFDHGAEPKEAAYVAQLPEAKLHAIAVFLSELKADTGSAAAPAPPKGDSGFINLMLKTFAPKQWKHEYKDIRTEDKPSGKQPADSPD